jgi:hypothetical protein
MALMFNPEPMPVDVMSALGALEALLVAVDALLVGEMTELMAKVRALGC